MTLLPCLKSALLIASAVLGLGQVSSANARSIEDIKKDGKILVATEGQFSPFNLLPGQPSSPASRWRWPRPWPPRWA